MVAFFLTCFLIGAALLFGQFLLSLLGLGHLHEFVAGHDFHVEHADHEGEGGWFSGMLTFRTLVAALTFFGLGGLAGNAEWGPERWPLTLCVAIAAGGGAFFLVGSVMRWLRQQTAEGTVHIDRAVGQPATVYLTVPGQKAGAGKVTVCVQNRTMEYQAVTPDRELPTGAKVVVVGVVNGDTVEVLSAPDSGV